MNRFGGLFRRLFRKVILHVMQLEGHFVVRALTAMSATEVMKTPPRSKRPAAVAGVAVAAAAGGRIRRPVNKVREFLAGCRVKKPFR